MHIARLSDTLFALALTAGIASAQRPGQPQASPAGDSAARVQPSAESPAQIPATIDPIEIPLRAASTTVRLGEIHAIVRQRGPVLEAQAAAVHLSDSLRLLSEKQASVPPAQMTRRAISSLASEWNRWDLRVRDWARVIRRRVVELDTLRAELDGSRALWQRTIARARLDATPQLIDEAVGVERRIGEQREVVLARQRELLATEVALTRAGETIDAGLAGVDAAYTDMRKQLFRLESPSLWTAIVAGGWPGLLSTIGTRWTGGVDSFAHFIDVNRSRVLFHAVVALGLLLTLLHLRRTARGTDASTATRHGAASGPSSEDHRWVLAHPRESTMLVAALLTAVLYPAAPLIAYDVSLILAAAAVWRLLPSLMPSEVVLQARLGIGLMAVDRAAVILLFATPWHRLAILGVAVAGLALSVSALRRLRSLDDAIRRLAVVRWSERAAAIAVLLTSSSIPSNVVGNVTLAQVFTSAVPVLAFLAIVAVAATKVINGVFIMAIDALSDDLRIIERKGPQLIQNVARLVRWGAVAAWIAAALSALLLWDPLSRMVSQVLQAGWSVGENQLSLADVLLFFATVWFGAVLGRWVALVLEFDVLDRLPLPHGMSVTMASIVQYALTAIAFFVALAVVGVNVGQLTIIGGALSVGVGFGLQTIVNNFISGLILAFERPVSIGDTIQLGDLEGVVTKIGIRASVIRATTGAEVIVPNGRLLDRDLVNWTRSDRSRRLEVLVSVEYGTDPMAIVSLVPAVVARHRDVRHAPAPVCLFTGFGESSTDFVVRFWTDAFDYAGVCSDIRLALNEALVSAGYSVPFPQRDLHLRSVSPQVAALLAAPSAPPRARHDDPIGVSS